METIKARTALEVILENEDKIEELHKQIAEITAASSGKSSKETIEKLYLIDCYIADILQESVAMIPAAIQVASIMLTFRHDEEPGGIIGDLDTLLNGVLKEAKEVIARMKTVRGILDMM